MPWWSWVLIWVGLVLLLIAVLAGCARLLFRKGAAVVRELDRLAEVQAEAAELAHQAALAREHAQQANRMPVAVGRHAEQVRTHHRQVREQLAERRELRREGRLARARALIHADPMQYRYLVNLKPKD